MEVCVLQECLYLSCGLSELVSVSKIWHVYPNPWEEQVLVQKGRGGRRRSKICSLLAMSEGRVSRLRYGRKRWNRSEVPHMRLSKQSLTNGNASGDPTLDYGDHIVPPATVGDRRFAKRFRILLPINKSSRSMSRLCHSATPSIQIIRKGKLASRHLFE